jgi:hypothetical protein
VIAYRAMLDVPRELVAFVSGLLRAHRRVLGTRKGTRILTTWRHTVFGLVWFRNRGVDIPQLGAGFGLSRATSYRYHDEVLAVLSAQAPDLTAGPLGDHPLATRIPGPGRAETGPLVTRNRLMVIGTLPIVDQPVEDLPPAPVREPVRCSPTARIGRDGRPRRGAAAGRDGSGVFAA